MKGTIPNSPFTTAISGSEKETDLRIRNIAKGKRKRPAVPLLAAIGVIILLCGSLIAWKSTSSIEQPDERIFCDYFADLYADYFTGERQRAYPASAAPEDPEEQDLCLDKVTYLDRTAMGDIIGAAYSVEYSWYRNNGSWEKETFADDLMIVTWTSKGDLIQVLGPPIYAYDGLTMEQIIQQRVWFLDSWDVSVRLEDGSVAVGPGSSWEKAPFFTIADSTLQVERLPGQYGEGSYEERWCLPNRITVTREYDGMHEGFLISRIDVTGDEFYCPRGIHVGSTEEELLAAYADVAGTDRWEARPEEGCYIYLDMMYASHGIRFFCADGMVTSIRLEAGLGEN